MAHKRLTYLDIPAARRKATAAKALGKLKEALSNPALTAEQDTTLRTRITHLNQWAAGKLAVQGGTHHEVEVYESLTLSEEGPS